MERGTVVTVIAYKGARLRRRVWADTGKGVLVCSEAEYQRALREGSEAQAAGFSKSDVVEVHAMEDAAAEDA